MPPALVAIIPPIVADAREARSTPDVPSAASHGRLNLFEGAPGANGDPAGRRDFGDPREPTQRDDHRLTGAWHRSADEAGIAALGHDGHTPAGTRRDNGRHLTRVRRPDDAGRPTAPASHPVGLVRRFEIVVDEEVSIAHHAAQFVEKGGLCHRRRIILSDHRCSQFDAAGGLLRPVTI
jgi:hypothetical protein